MYVSVCLCITFFIHFISPVVFDVIVRPSGQALGDFGPSIPQLSVRVGHYLLLRLGPRALPNRGVWTDVFNYCAVRESKNKTGTNVIIQLTNIEQREVKD